MTQRRLWMWGLGLCFGLALVIWPGRFVSALIGVPSPTVTIRTVSGDVERTTTAPLGASVPVDVDGDRRPDIDAGLALTDAAAVADRPAGGPLVPTMTISRNAAAIADVPRPGARRSPPLTIEVILSSLDPTTSATDTVSIGFDTQPGGSIPATFKASLLSGLGSLTLDPLEAAVSTPGYNGPLRLYSNLDSSSLLGAFSLSYDPLPERVGFLFRRSGGKTTFRYDQSSLVPDVDLDSRIFLSGSDGSVAELSTLVQRLPATLEGSVTSSGGGGSFEYRTSGPTAAPDISATLRGTQRNQPPTYAEAHVAGLPSRISAAWSPSRIDFCAGELAGTACISPVPIGSVSFEIRNFLDPADAPEIPAGMRLPPADHVEFFSRNAAAGSRFRARGSVSRIVNVSYADDPAQGKVVHAQLGDGAHPFRAGIDVEELSGRFFVDTTITNLPSDLTVRFRKQDDTRPEDVPLLVSYDASAAADVTSHVEITDSLRTGCRRAGSTCVDTSVRHVPASLVTTFASAQTQGTLRVRATPRSGGAQPDITTDVVRVPASGGSPVELHARILRFPRHLVARYHVTGAEPDLVDLHACDWNGSACAAGSEGAIGQVSFRLRDFVEGGFGTDEIAPTSYLAVVARKNPGRFEVSGQATEMRALAYRKVGQVGGVQVDMGRGEPFRAHVDIDTPDELPRAKQQIVDSLVSALPDRMNVCFRSPSESKPVAVPDPSGITTPCQSEPGQTNPDFWGTLETTPFTVIYDATAATAASTPVVQAKAKILYGGADPAGAGERADPAETITVDTVVDKLPRKITANYLPARDVAKCCFGQPLKVSYMAPAPVDKVTFALADRMGTSQCSDPRPGKAAMCLDATIDKLPSTLLGTVVSKALPDAPSTRFQFRASADGAATRIGCTGLTSVCTGGFKPGVRLAKVDNAGSGGICPTETCGDPLVLEAAIESLPSDVSGRLDEGVKVASDGKPTLTKLAIESCRWPDLGAPEPACPGGTIPAFVGAVRFGLQNFLVPDPIPPDNPAGQFFHLVKRDHDFRISGGIAGLKGAAYTSPGDTTAVRVDTTDTKRDLDLLFDLEDALSKIRVAGQVSDLSPALGFCFRPGRQAAHPGTGVPEGLFCDASGGATTAANASPPDPATRLRLSGPARTGGPKPTALISFLKKDAATVLDGKVTAVGLPAVMQASFDGGNVAFNKPDTRPELNPPTGMLIDSVRFDVRNFEGAVPGAEPFGSERFAGDDPIAYPRAGFPQPYVSVVKNDRHLQAKGIVNKIGEVFLLDEPCRYPAGATVPSPHPVCTHLRARAGAGLAEHLRFYLHLLDGDAGGLAGARRTFLTADVGPLSGFLDAFIDTGSDGFDARDPNALTTDRPPLISVNACEGAGCAVGPGGSPTLRAIFEMGKVGQLEVMSLPFRDPLLNGGTLGEPDNKLPAQPLNDPFYNDPVATTAAADLYDALSPSEKNTPPAATQANATAFRIADVDTTGQKETVLRGRLKVPFPASLVLDRPVIVGSTPDDEKPDDPYDGQKRTDIHVRAEARGFGPQPGPPLNLGRAVVVLDDLRPQHGGEKVLIASDLPGVTDFSLRAHREKKRNVTFVDAQGDTSAQISRFELRMWDDGDGETEGVARNAKARGGVVVPNMRLNAHRIPQGKWRGRVYLQDEDDLKARTDPRTCKPFVEIVIVDGWACAPVRYLDFGVDFDPVQPARPGKAPARRIDAAVTLKGGANVKVNGFASVAPSDTTPADFDVRAALRIDPLKVSFRAGIPFLAGAFFTLRSHLDVNLFVTGQSEFQLAFAPPAHAALSRNDPDGADSDHASGGLQPGIRIRPLWDVDNMFGYGAILNWIFFGTKNTHINPVLMPGLACDLGGALGGVGTAFPELDLLNDLVNGSDFNGFALVGKDNYSRDIVLNAITPSFNFGLIPTTLPWVVLFDSQGGSSTRGIAAILNGIFCNIHAGPIPADALAFRDPLPPLPSPGNPSPTQPPASPAPGSSAPPSPPAVTVAPNATLHLCGRHVFASLDVQGTLKVSKQAVMTQGPGGTQVPKLYGDGYPVCAPGDEGTLRVRSKGTISVSGKIDASAVATREPPVRPDTALGFQDVKGTPASGCGGGAGYGGDGGSSACGNPGGPGGKAYGNDVLPPATDTASDGTTQQVDAIHNGSPGIAGAATFGAGGGLVQIEAETVNLLGSIQANGAGGADAVTGQSTCESGAGGGGGSGGGVHIQARKLVMGAGAISAAGGNGGGGTAGGGGGGGGRVKVVAIIPGQNLSGVVDVGGGNPGPSCPLTGASAQPGQPGTTWSIGGISSEAMGASSSRQSDVGAVTRWTKATSVNLSYRSASSSGHWPNHEVMRCHVYEPPERANNSGRLPEAQALTLPTRNQGETVSQYLVRPQLNCDFSGVHRSVPNGTLASGTFGGVPVSPEGYYGFFTMGARPVNDAPQGSTPKPGTSPVNCFGLFISGGTLESIHPDCVVEPLPGTLDLVLGVDRQAPRLVGAFDHFKLDSAQRFEEAGSAPNNVLWTNRNRMGLSVGWEDLVGTVVPPNASPDITTHLLCLENETGSASKVCYGPSSLDPALRAFPPSVSWGLSPGDGAKTVSVTVEDMAGNALTLGKALKVDTTPPQVSASITPPGTGWFTTPPTVSVSGSDAGIGGVKLYYVFDRAGDGHNDYDPLSPPKMPEGHHRVFGVARDGLGNEAVSSYVEAKVDTRDPVAAVSVVPGAADGDNSWYRFAPFVGVSAADDGSGVAAIRVQTGPDENNLGTEQTTACPNGPRRCSSAFFQVPEGTTVVCARAVDVAGRVQPQRSCSPLVRVDSKAPASSVSAPAPSGEHGWHLPPPDASISSADAGSGLCAGATPCALRDLDVPQAGLWVSVDGAPFQRQGSPGFATQVPEGLHDLRWFAADAAGNREPISSKAFKVDLSTPVSSLLGFPPAPNAAGWYRSAVLSTVLAEDGPQGSGITDVVFGVDAAARSAYARPFKTGEGNHTISVQARDRAGRRETPHGHSFRVDVRAPAARPGFTPTVPEPQVRLLFTAFDDRSQAIRTIVRLLDLSGRPVRDLDLGQVPPGDVTAFWDRNDASGDRVPPGIYYFRVLVVDEAGNTGMSEESRAFVMT